MGRAVAERFAREGAEVVVSEIDPKRGQATVERISATGGTRSLFKPTWAKVCCRQPGRRGKR